MTVELSDVVATRTSWPAWNARGRIKRVNAEGKIVAGEWACNGEFVRISPRFQRGGSTFRVRPERPGAFFAAWLTERGILPTPLTPEECTEEWALEMLDPLWARYKGNFMKLESPYAACDHGTVPSHRTGFSFCVLQTLVQETGSVSSSTSRQPGMMGQHVQGGGENHEAIRRRIEEMRARAGRSEASNTVKAKK